MHRSTAKSFIPHSFIALAMLCFFVQGCGGSRSQTLPETNLDKTAPKRMLWAWERPEDLRFITTKDFGVAFLAQTITLSGSDVKIAPRRQPLEVNPGTFLMAVTRIETDKDTKPKLDHEQREKIANAVRRTLQLKNVSAVQIDFDVAVSERDFYRALMKDLRAQIPAEISFSMTALASWCNESWLEGMPVDEAVPMSFRMGADAGSIRAFLANGKDWQEPLCKKSYGFSIDEPFEKKIDPVRRIYFFNDRAWKADDLNTILNYQ